MSDPWAPPGGTRPTGAPAAGPGQQPAPAAQPQAAPMPGHAPQAQQPQAGGLMLRTSFFVLAFLLHFFPPSTSIDGGPAFKLRWGDNHLPGLPPGHHRIRVWFRYLFFGDCGIADAVIEVPPEGMFLEYKAPTWFVFSKGTFPSLAAAAAPAAVGAERRRLASGSHRSRRAALLGRPGVDRARRAWRPAGLGSPLSPLR